MSTEFKKYMNSYSHGWIIATIVVSSFAILFAVVAVVNRFPVTASLIFLVIGIPITLIPIFISYRFFERLANEEDVDLIENDFANAYPMRNDTIRFGERWIFCKNSARLIRYEEIKQVYQYIHKTNFLEDMRAVKIADINGKHRIICKLELRGASDEELKQIMMIIYQKNPRVKLGYR